MDAGLRGAGQTAVRLSGLGHDEVQLHNAEHGHDDEANETTFSCPRHQGSQLESPVLSIR